MVVHSKYDHTTLNMIESPVCFTQKELDQLLSIRPANGECRVTAFVCGGCHQLKKTKDISFLDHIQQDIYKLVCPLCRHESMNIKEMKFHDEKRHNIQMALTKYADKLDCRMERHYYRTKVMFSNGLVLFKQNLIKTSVDESVAFWSLKKKLKEKQLNDCSKPMRENSPGLPYDLRKKELKQQSKYRNHLCIFGITGEKSDAQLWEIYEAICAATEIQARREDVLSITQRESDILIKFHLENFKKEIMIKWKRLPKRYIVERLGHLDRRPEKIEMRSHYSRFFEPLARLAEKALKDGDIHYVFLRGNALNVQIRNKERKVIWSETDLLDYIKSSKRKPYKRHEKYH